MTDILAAVGTVLTPSLLLLMALGVVIGAVAGVVPGLTGGIALAVFLPLTFGMEALPALIFLLSIYTGSTWGGALTAILINTPGSPASAVTQLDGYPMTQRGESSRAVGLSLGASMLGAMIGAIVLIFAIQPLGRFALQLHASERFLIAFFGLAVIAGLGAKRPAKAYLAGLFGILLGTVGIGATGAARGTLGVPYLLDGIQFIPALIGIFMVPEIFRLMGSEYITHENTIPRHSLRRVLGGVGEVLKFPFALVRSAVTGVLVGAIPAAGATVATLISYNQATTLTTPRGVRYGDGAPEGIIAAEAANSSSEGGSMATTFALGIPGGTGAAVMIGAMVSVGWVPGPQLISEQIDIIRSVLWGQFFQALLLLPLGIIVAYVASRVIFVPTRILVPVISVAAVAGSYGVRGNMLDVVVLLAFGLVGYVMRRYDYPLIALILGLILGPLADAELTRVSQLYAGDYSVFLTRPISVVMLVGGALLTLYAVLRPRLERRKAARQSFPVS